MTDIKTDPGMDVKGKSSPESKDGHAQGRGCASTPLSCFPGEDLETFIVEADQVFNELITYHRKRVEDFAARINPRLTADDLLNPHDFEELENNGHFQYEDGILNGCIAAQAALRRFFAEKLASLSEAQKNTSQKQSS